MRALALGRGRLDTVVRTSSLKMNKKKYHESVVRTEGGRGDGYES
jgi:hypothetical protein